MEVTTKKRDTARRWIVIVVIALSAHLFLLLGVKPGYFDIFRKSFDNNLASSSRLSSMPDAIVAVTVRVEGEEPRPVRIEPTPEQPRKTETQPTIQPGDKEEPENNILEILGDATSPLPSRASSRNTVIPPRPVEITWPDTKNLGHCLGMHVDVRIQVDETGKIRIVEPIARDLPEDCVDAAIRAARRIVFLPGRSDGKPHTMWTEIRIDFRRQDH